MNSSFLQTVHSILMIIALSIGLLLLVTYLISMGLGIHVLFYTTEGADFSRSFIILNPLLIAGTQLVVNAGLYFLFLWCVFALCFIAAWKFRKTPIQTIRQLLLHAGNRNYWQNNLLAMPLITSTLLVSVVALDFLQSRSGLPTGSLPQVDPFLDFMNVSRAALIEEVIFRVIPIGIFLAIQVYLIGKTTKPFFSRSQRLTAIVISIFNPEKAKRMIGLKARSGNSWLGTLTMGEWAIAIFAALLFGLAHYFGGWGPGKISQASISGLIFAFSYLYYGIQAPILLHWFFNYYFAAFELSAAHGNTIDLLHLVWQTNIFLGMLLLISLALWIIPVIEAKVHAQK